jgi:hypothetical protein
MEEKIYNIEPHKLQGILISDGYTYKIITASKNHTARVKVDFKIVSTGERAYTFENNNDSAVAISIIKK